MKDTAEVWLGTFSLMALKTLKPWVRSMATELRGASLRHSLSGPAEAWSKRVRLLLSGACPRTTARQSSMS
jgi:hypothetical protein